MVTTLVQCPRCGGAEVIKAGTQPNGAQRYRCQKAECTRTVFQLAYSDTGRLPETKRQIVDMALNGSGVCDTARVLGIGTGTVINELKKKDRAPAGQHASIRGDQGSRYHGHYS